MERSSGIEFACKSVSKTLDIPNLSRAPASAFLRCLPGLAWPGLAWMSGSLPAHSSSIPVLPRLSNRAASQQQAQAPWTSAHPPILPACPVLPACPACPACCSPKAGAAPGQCEAGDPNPHTPARHPQVRQLGCSGSQRQPASKPRVQRRHAAAAAACRHQRSAIDQCPCTCMPPAPLQRGALQGGLRGRLQHPHGHGAVQVGAC